jgi:hypothetical protein
VAEESHFGRSLGAASDAVVSVFYPAGCELCDQLLTRASRVPICEKCLASFPALPAEVCEFCGTTVATPFAPGAGQPLEAEASGATPRGCFACQGRPYAFARAAMPPTKGS